MASLTKAYSKEKLTGQIFTPYFIVEKILDDVGYILPENIIGKTILDPACGDGRFLTKIAERIIKVSPPDQLIENLENIHGWDTDAKAVKQAINNLDALINDFDIQVDWNIRVQNALHKGVSGNHLSSQSEAGKKFDFIVGNPPYIRIQHLEMGERKFIQNHYSFCQSGSTDIYIAFYELAMNLIKDTGICGYITPNTFFHTETAKTLRNHFATKQNLVQITNYGAIQLFDNATTYNAIVVFNHQKNNDFMYQKAIDKTNFKNRKIDFEEIQNRKFWQLSLHKTALKKGKRLGDIAKIHVGITTLSDKIYIMPWVKKDKKYTFLQSKFNDVIQVENDILKPIIKVSTLKSGDEPIKEYVLFPYKKVEGRMKIIPENELKTKFPMAYQYLRSVKDILDKRDNGKKNAVAWYAFGRTQALQTSFGEKILFSPMNKEPNFILSKNKEATFYSGYCIKYEGNRKKLLNQLNSERMAEYIRVTARDFRAGWKAYNKKIVQEFIIYD